jgi:hypothetical protein
MWLRERGKRKENVDRSASAKKMLLRERGKREENVDRRG